MAVKAGPVLVLTAKWLLVPIALGVVGYYFVGPKIGATAPTAKKERSQDAPPGFDDTSEEVSNKYPAPDVEVSVKKGTTIREGSRRSSSTRRSKPKPKVEDTKPKEDEAPPVEETGPPLVGAGGETIPVQEPPPTTTTTGGGDGG